MYIRSGFVLVTALALSVGCGGAATPPRGPVLGGPELVVYATGRVPSHLVSVGEVTVTGERDDARIDRIFEEFKRKVIALGATAAALDSIETTCDTRESTRYELRESQRYEQSTYGQQRDNVRRGYHNGGLRTEVQQVPRLTMTGRALRAESTSPAAAAQ